MAKIEIVVGKQFSADFTVVSDDGVTGIPLVGTDTAVFMLSLSGVNPEVVLQDIPLTIIDAENGMFNLTLEPADTIGLKQYIGFREDNFPTIGNYIGLIDFSLSDGNRQATFDVYVKEIGIKDEQE